jgi:hypothetical protein
VNSLAEAIPALLAALELAGRLEELSTRQACSKTSSSR